MKTTDTYFQRIAFVGSSGELAIELEATIAAIGFLDKANLSPDERKAFESSLATMRAGLDRQQALRADVYATRRGRP